jgi:hypothetical protein
MGSALEKCESTLHNQLIYKDKDVLSVSTISTGGQEMATGRTQISKIREKRAALRKELWGNLDLSWLWNRKTHNGFITIPRTMPIILQIIDDLSKGTPASSTYFALWCRSLDDDSMIEIKDRNEFALESVFSGSRAVSTWTARMKLLRDLQFIDTKEVSHEFSYVLIWNPHLVLKSLASNQKIPRMEFYNSLVKRAIDIGCKDFIEVKSE